VFDILSLEHHVCSCFHDYQINITLQAFPPFCYPRTVNKMLVQLVLTGPNAKIESTPVADSTAHIPKHEVILSVIRGCSGSFGACDVTFTAFNQACCESVELNLRCICAFASL
jgi:hypothetical protein